MSTVIIPIGTRVRTLKSYPREWLFDRYADRTAYVSRISSGRHLSYELLFEGGQTLAWYDPEQFIVVPVDAAGKVEDALQFIEWFNNR